MNTEPKDLELVNGASKFETLLYQFIKLYDRLTVEHSLMNDRELKLIKNLEGLKETVEELNQLSPQIIEIIKDTTKQEVNRIYQSLVTKIDNIEQNINNVLDTILNDCCNKLNAESNKITKLSKDCWDLNKKLVEDLSLIKIFVLMLIGLAGGLIIGYFIMK